MRDVNLRAVPGRRRRCATERTGAQDSKLFKRFCHKILTRMGQSVFNFKEPNSRKSKLVTGEVLINYPL